MILFISPTCQQAVVRKKNGSEWTPTCTHIWTCDITALRVGRCLVLHHPKADIVTWPAIWTLLVDLLLGSAWTYFYLQALLQATSEIPTFGANGVAANQAENDGNVHFQNQQLFFVDMSKHSRTTVSMKNLPRIVEPFWQTWANTCFLITTNRVLGGLGQLTGHCWDASAIMSWCLRVTGRLPNGKRWNCSRPGAWCIEELPFGLSKCGPQDVPKLGRTWRSHGQNLNNQWWFNHHLASPSLSIICHSEFFQLSFPCWTQWYIGLSWQLARPEVRE